jgi:hypothetical protein
VVVVLEVALEEVLLVVELEVVPEVVLLVVLEVVVVELEEGNLLNFNRIRCLNLNNFISI